MSFAAPRDGPRLLCVTSLRLLQWRSSAQPEHFSTFSITSQKLSRHKTLIASAISTPPTRLPTTARSTRIGIDVAFKVFEKGSAPTPSVPAVTIQKRGLFSLNDAAYKLLGEPEFITFLYDADERLIALRATDSSDLNGYPARRQSPANKSKKSSGPILIAGSMFTRFIGMDTSEARRWTPELRDGMLVIDRKIEGTAVISNRNRARQFPTATPDQLEKQIQVKNEHPHGHANDAQ